MARLVNLTPINKRLAKKISNLSAMDKLYWDVIRDDGVLNVGYLQPGSQINYDNETGVPTPKLGKVPKTPFVKDSEFFLHRFAFEDLVYVVNSANVDQWDFDDTLGFNSCKKDCGNPGWQYEDQKHGTSHRGYLNDAYETRELIDWVGAPELKKKVSVRYPKVFKAVVKSDTYKKIKRLTRKMQEIREEEDRLTDLFDSGAIPYETVNIYKDSSGFDDLEKEREKLGKRIDKTYSYQMMKGYGYGKSPLKLKFGWAKEGVTYDVIAGSWEKVLDSDGKKYGGIQYNRRNSFDDEITGEQLVATTTLKDLGVDLLNSDISLRSRFMSTVGHEVAHFGGLDHKNWNPDKQNLTSQDTIMSYNMAYFENGFSFGFTPTDRYAIWSMLDEMMAIEVAEDL